MFTGRAVAEGEPLFTQADTDGALALAEEEADTCPSCGFPKVWCRDRDNQFAFMANEEQCHATYALVAHQAAVNQKRDESTRRAIQMSARFRPDAEPDLLAGLDLEGRVGADPVDDAED